MKAAIGATIQAFFDARKPGDEFHLSDLTAFVWARHNTAAGSPDRILRDMRQAGEINYRCVKRDESLYEVLTAVESAKEAA